MSSKERLKLLVKLERELKVDGGRDDALKRYYYALLNRPLVLEGRVWEVLCVEGSRVLLASGDEVRYVDA